MEAISPSTYMEYVSVGKNKRKILYMWLHKALYGFLRSALLLYHKLKGDLEAFGFLLNIYDYRVSNKWFNGSQMTVNWHVVSLKYPTRTQVR